jgi:elongation factor G
MHGMGMLHLEIKVHRMERDFHLKIKVGQPLVSFRETLRRPRTVEGDCHARAGTANLAGKVRVEFTAHAGEHLVEVISRVPPETLLPEYVAAAERGIRNALESGELGFPVMNVRAIVKDGEMDQQLSNEMAFEAAGADAVHQAMRENIVLLEPMMHLEVTVPEEYLGPITSDLSARRAEITQILQRGKLRVVEAHVPLRRMLDYADKVRSLSQGRASSTMEPHGYAPAPDDVLQAMLHPEGSY